MPPDTSGTLYVVATPIGNLEDLSPRALRTLREVALVAAEDTRVTRKLLAHHGVHTPLTSCHSHTGEGKIARLCERLTAGDDLALVSDAGTPGVSDPGGELVRAAIAAGVRVVPIPGPSAVLAALSASGLDPTRFLFEGFLPRGRSDRRRALRRLAALPHTLVFFEAPGRAAGTIAALREELGDRNAVVAREVTKLFEEFARGPLSDLEARCRAEPPRGECVIVVEGARDAPAAVVDPTPRLKELLAQGLGTREAARQVADEIGGSRRELYALALRLTDCS